MRQVPEHCRAGLYPGMCRPKGRLYGKRCHGGETVGSRLAEMLFAMREEELHRRANMKTAFVLICTVLAIGSVGWAQKSEPAAPSKWQT